VAIEVSDAPKFNDIDHLLPEARIEITLENESRLKTCQAWLPPLPIDGSRCVGSNERPFSTSVTEASPNSIKT
jgi:hypothetical protein